MTCNSVNTLVGKNLQLALTMPTHNAQHTTNTTVSVPGVECSALSHLYSIHMPITTQSLLLRTVSEHKDTHKILPQTTHQTTCMCTHTHTLILSGNVWWIPYNRRVSEHRSLSKGLGVREWTPSLWRRT